MPGGHGARTKKKVACLSCYCYVLVAVAVIVLVLVAVPVLVLVVVLGLGLLLGGGGGGRGRPVSQVGFDRRAHKVSRRFNKHRLLRAIKKPNGDVLLSLPDVALCLCDLLFASSACSFNTNMTCRFAPHQWLKKHFHES